MGITVLRLQPAGSPWIAFTGVDGNISSIYVVRADGSHSAQLTDSATDDYSPRWLDDGWGIGYASRAGGYEAHYRVDFKGQIDTIPATKRPLAANYSPQRDWILMIGYDNENWDIYRMRPDGSERQRLTTHPAQDGFPAWSSDGKWIAFASDRSGSWEIYRMQADGTQTEQLTNNGLDNWQPTWSPKLDLHWSITRNTVIGLLLVMLGTIVRRLYSYKEFINAHVSSRIHPNS